MRSDSGDLISGGNADARLPAELGQREQIYSRISDILLLLTLSYFSDDDVSNYCRCVAYVFPSSQPECALATKRNDVAHFDVSNPAITDC